jgi:hypothetical protein
MTARGGIYGDLHGDGKDVSPIPTHHHEWSKWKVIGYTGDWFHPRIVERTCEICSATEQAEH